MTKKSKYFFNPFSSIEVFDTEKETLIMYEDLISQLSTITDVYKISVHYITRGVFIKNTVLTFVFYTNKSASKEGIIEFAYKFLVNYLKEKEDILDFLVLADDDIRDVNFNKRHKLN
jgi:nicotinic acid phosphoribosyltransferase